MSKQKMAMQIAIELVQKEGFEASPMYELACINIAKKLTVLLPAERQQIEDAWNAANDTVFNSASSTRSSSDYFTQTFEQ